MGEEINVTGLKPHCQNGKPYHGYYFVFVKDDMGVFRGIHGVGFFFKAKGMFKPGFFFDIPMFFYSFAVRKLQRVITKRKQNGKD